MRGTSSASPATMPRLLHVTSAIPVSAMPRRVECRSSCRTRAGCELQEDAWVDGRPDGDQAHARLLQTQCGRLALCGLRNGRHPWSHGLTMTGALARCDPYDFVRAGASKHRRQEWPRCRRPCLPRSARGHADERSQDQARWTLRIWSRPPTATTPWPSAVDVSWDEAEAESTKVSDLRSLTQSVGRPKRDRSRSASTTS